MTPQEMIELCSKYWDRGSVPLVWPTKGAGRMPMRKGVHMLNQTETETVYDVPVSTILRFVAKGADQK